MKKGRGGNVKGRDTDTEKNRENSRLKENNTHTHTNIQCPESSIIPNQQFKFSNFYYKKKIVFTIEVVFG